MSKRGRGGDQLTGGSRDVNPQTMLLSGAKQTTADTPLNVLVGTGLPIPRLPIMKGRSLVMELLSCDFYLLQPGYAAGTVTYQTVWLTTNPSSDDTNGTGNVVFQDPRTIAQWTRVNVAGATLTSFVEFENIKHIDLTDEAGHGILVATDNLYFGVSSINTAAINSAFGKVTYRFKDVSLEEYIGIVQSQQ